MNHPMTVPRLTEIIRAHRGDVELLVAALHEAGHAEYCLAHGIPVGRVHVIPDDRIAGFVEHGYLWPPRNADAAPRSPWMDVTVSLCLAGDRAVRLWKPDDTTVGGGPGSDHARAVRFLQAVHAQGEIEGELDRLSRTVDAFFQRDRVQRMLAALVDALLTHRDLSGVEVRNLLCGGPDLCGALADDDEAQCNQPVHSAKGDHHQITWDDRGRSEVTWRHVDFESEGLPGIRRSHRPAVWRKVFAAMDPTPPAPRREPRVEDIQYYWERWADLTLTNLQRIAALGTYTRLIRDRDRPEARSQLSAPERLRHAADTRSAIARHGADCDEPVEPSLDGEIWCPDCGFEEPEKTRGWIYFLLGPTGPVGPCAFHTAAEARTALRLQDPRPRGITIARLPIIRRRRAGSQQPKKETNP